VSLTRGSIVREIATVVSGSLCALGMSNRESGRALLRTAVPASAETPATPQLARI
jgi:hypothetical protein